MTPEEAEARLLSLELFGMRFGLDRMRRLMTALGHPERKFRSIHVVGTNGKSSTTRMIAAILAHHGHRVGSYLSPHLVGFNERIRVDDHDITPQQLADAIERALRAADQVNRSSGPDDPVTQFELLTAAAYSELAEQHVEVAVIEAGLGGRYDATNVIPSSVQVLTSVGLEHTRWLGPTVTAIAREKLDVVQPGLDARARPRYASGRASWSPRRSRLSAAPRSCRRKPTRTLRSVHLGSFSAATSRSLAPRRRRSWASSTSALSSRLLLTCECPAGSRSSTSGH